jgi:hypothetical protein
MAQINIFLIKILCVDKTMIDKNVFHKRMNIKPYQKFIKNVNDFQNYYHS